MIGEFGVAAPRSMARSAAVLVAGCLGVCLSGLGTAPAMAQDGARSLSIYRYPSNRDDLDGVLGGGWQNQRRYGYQGPAGVYSCEQGRVDTYLARKACGGAKFPNRFF